MINKILEFSNLKFNDQFVSLIGNIHNNFLINQDYKNICLLNYKCEVLKVFKSQNDILISSSYINQDQDEVLIYDDEYSCLYHISLDNFQRITKIKMPEKVFLTEFYVWDEDRCLIVDTRQRVYEFSVDKGLRFLNNVESLNQFDFLKKLVACNVDSKVLFFDSQKEVIVYRAWDQNDNQVVVWNDASLDINLKIQAPIEDIHAAVCCDDLLILIHEDLCLFYSSQGRELFKLNKKHTDFIYIKGIILHYEDGLYFVINGFNVNNPKKNETTVYKIMASV